MGNEEKRRSMASYVQAMQIRTKRRLSEQEVFPLPEIGSVIIFNENLKCHDKYEGFPRVGIGTVEKRVHHIIAIKEISPRGNIFLTSLTVSQLSLGLYRYVQLKKLPDRLLSKKELRIDDLPDDIEELVVYRPQSFKAYIDL